MHGKTLHSFVSGDWFLLLLLLLVLVLLYADISFSFISEFHHRGRSGIADTKSQNSYSKINSLGFSLAGGHKL